MGRQLKLLLAYLLLIPPIILSGCGGAAAPAGTPGIDDGGTNTGADPLVLPAGELPPLPVDEPATATTSQTSSPFIMGNDDLYAISEGVELLETGIRMQPGAGELQFAIYRCQPAGEFPDYVFDRPGHTVDDNFFIYYANFTEGVWEMAHLGYDSFSSNPPQLMYLADDIRGCVSTGGWVYIAVVVYDGLSLDINSLYAPPLSWRCENLLIETMYGEYVCAGLEHDFYPLDMLFTGEIHATLDNPYLAAGAAEHGITIALTNVAPRCFVAMTAYPRTDGGWDALYIDDYRQRTDFQSHPMLRSDVIAIGCLQAVRTAQDRYYQAYGTYGTFAELVAQALLEELYYIGINARWPSLSLVLVTDGSGAGYLCQVTNSESNLVFNMDETGEISWEAGS
ncbi:hypothetical protein JW859_11520 [bacterium]|nr:hypothetical protein [bacterium]